MRLTEQQKAQERLAAQERTKYLEENMHPCRPNGFDLTADEIQSMCEFSLGKEWWEYFYGEFPNALYPGGGGWGTMCELKHTCDWTTWELLTILVMGSSSMSVVPILG